MSEFWNEYNQYLESEEWENLRWQVLQRDPICKHCGKEYSTVAHHKNTTDWKTATVNDLEGVCYKCHQKAHGDR